jgi:excisionase family DNA binding protein
MTAVLLTVEDAAQALALGRTKIYELVDTGALRSVKIGRSRRIPVQALHEFVRSINSCDSSEELSTDSVGHRLPRHLVLTSSQEA